MKKNKNKRPPIPKGTFGRILKMLFGYYPVLAPVTVVCVIFSAVVSSIPSVFMQKVIAVIEELTASGDWTAAKTRIIPLLLILASLYLLSILSLVLYTQLMAYMTQGFLHNLRRTLFDRMQNLPIRYFDTHKKGDIMSTYTNDIDAVRQLVSQALPMTLQSGVIVLTVFGIMIYYCGWLTLLVLAGVAIMTVIARRFGGGSAKYFIRQQTTLGKVEGYVQEMMNGRKVIKVFNHEAQTKAQFDVLNDELNTVGYKAHAYANSLGPVIMNVGNVLYVLTALIGGLLLLFKVPNFSLSGMAISISIVVPFLNMTKQFTGNVNQVSQQLNSLVMALAGAGRVFDLMDQEPEADDGYVTLVNVTYGEDGSVSESDAITGQWAWKHPHAATGEVTYTPLRGDVTLNDVDFGYTPEKTVLHHISLYAKPGQKVAFVGATGAGKTTITNLLNRFYDIADGKIRYDGININKIRKSDLRRSLGLVLQETTLFTGTVMDNIRYGRLDATDEECVSAAKTAGAHDFITRLPEGYQTQLFSNGANLSQGQRQLLAIARAAVADPPVMILDEATSSIDTRTEAIVQQGMDALMKGRTVFVIAHRLSTVKNSDVIIVLDHGNIIERGDHEQLIAQKGVYYRLYTGAFELE